MAISNNSARQTHVSPGIYTKETDLTYASKSLGITTLGVVGETLKGPAFQPIAIEDWRQFQSYFGGTSTEKYKGSQYPKYELPYIAKTYLEESKQLQVCRVLGLSGTNAGPAWVISAYSSKAETTSPYVKEKPLVIAVLRSRGEHKKAALVKVADETTCEDVYEYDKISYYAKSVRLVPSKSLVSSLENCKPGYNTTTGDFKIDVLNYGTFTIEVTLNDGEEGKETKKNYSVSLNPNTKNYIYNVIGGKPEEGDAEVYVEELYDVALRQLIERGQIDEINSEVTTFEPIKIIPSHAAVTDLLTVDESMLTRKDVGKRFLYSVSESVNNENGHPLTVHTSNDKGKTWVSSTGEVGHIYTVVSYTTTDGTREYYYGEYLDSGDNRYKVEKLCEPIVDQKTKICTEAVVCLTDGLTYVYNVSEDNDADVRPITFDMNNYKESYRYATTPWIVSELKGSAEHVELSKLFRFNTISDGNASNTEVKVSIENIDPVYGTFDVIVRSFYDSDASPIVLERYKGCDLVPGSQNYVAYKIGSTDETYETKSRYITVEVNENDITKTSIPAGFLGYPVRNYNGRQIGIKKELSNPYFEYNTNIDEDIRINRQYFGVSDLVGIDEDVLSYKGVEAYNNVPEGLTPCFHLDSRILTGVPDKDGKITENNISQTVSVDGMTGYRWVTVGKGNMTSYGIEPRLGDEATMLNTIYEDKRYRKFTVAFYGGYDGWDYYRTSRSNTDEFTYRKYRGNLNTATGHGSSFDVIRDVETYGFEAGTRAITSDWYAYLSAIRQLANPKTIDINVLATPGIDYVNNKSLVDEVIDMVESERADCIYVVTTPDKPFGASDSESEMYTPDEAVDNLDDSNIDSNYTCTYYPWVKTFDTDNNQYIYLPTTKDVVKNFAYTDNTAYPWFAAAGYNRGLLDGVNPKKILKLSEQDELYSGRINFINKFAKEGMRIWGDKNLQITETQMNRISKRRLLIRIRKLLSIACIGLLFDPNDNTVVKSFKAAVDPILDDIRNKRGITDYRIEVDDSQEARDRLELPAKIYLKLQPNLEYITIDFVITPQGASFDDI